MSFTAENTIFDRMRALEERVLQQEKTIQAQQNTILEHQHKLEVHDTKLLRIMYTIYQIIGKVFCQEADRIFGLNNYMNYGVTCTTRWLYGDDEKGVYVGNIPDELTYDTDEEFEEKYYDFTETFTPASKPLNISKFPIRCISRESHVPETPRKMSQVPLCLDLSLEDEETSTSWSILNTNWHSLSKTSDEKSPTHYH